MARGTGAAAAPAKPVAALLPLFVIGAILSWWAWERGAYFAVNFLPGAAILLGLLIALLLYAPWPGRLVPPASYALFALLAISAWTLLSALWSPAPDIAIGDAQRVLIYAVAFVLGAWLCLLLGRRMQLSLAPLAAAGAVVALATLLAVSFSGDAAELLEIDGTLRYPLGYRNAVAAFFLISLLPMVSLAISSELDWRLRGALAGSATLALELALLAQSRTSVFAALGGAAVLIALHPRRLAAAGWLALAVLPALPALPFLLDVFTAEGGNTVQSLDPLRTAAAAMAVTSLASLALGCLAARRDPLISLSAGAARAVGRVLGAAAAVAVLAGAVAVLTAEGGPRGVIDRQVGELTAGSPDLSSEGSRFGFDLRSERGDLWRVALDEFVANPVAGEGAGGFRFAYLRERENALQPEDPHSVELLMASELGLPGLLGFVAFAVGATLAALRSRRLGPSAAALAATSLAIAAYWLLHASVEWFWSYPAVTFPMAFSLGAAAGPALLARPQAPDRRARIGLSVAAGLAALSMLPFFLSERYTNDALRGWRSDLPRAYSDLDRAAALNPFGVRPLSAEAVIAQSAGEPQRALAALSEARQRTPQEWTLYYLEARLLAATDAESAQRALARARELNPRGEEIARLQQQLGGAAP